ncbi:uncharacterized protein At5g65660-like [Nicotiana tabacum]|uniref:Uncharacterized protein At5g65660-like n=2 Tax=Nicotiana TaxID=4085 RepID=A0A1S3ZL36_TOBAC|nr:PREDICTED: uncharacterized protein LOC104244765 [Nicotiana sylvestris]XP_016464963.1 PREDICTED: uncharacterized protein LOC107787864 [Nicotiana tabacum]
MGEEEGWDWPPTPSGSPMYITKDDHWTHFDNSVNAVSFGFVATAILISMFLVMAIFERFLRPNSPALSPSGGRNLDDIESQIGFNGKLGYPTSKVSANAREVSVLMPGEDIPTFIANPVPVPCPPERDPWPPHQQHSLPGLLNPDSNA